MIFSIKKYKTSTGETRERSRVQCLRVFPDEILPSGQARRQVVTTLDRWATTLPKSAKGILTKEEQAEWVRWKAKHDAAHDRDKAYQALDSLTQQLDLAKLAIHEGATHSDPRSLWAALGAFSDAMAKSGIPRPKRPRGRPKTRTEGF